MLEIAYLDIEWKQILNIGIFGLALYIYMYMSVRMVYIYLLYTPLITWPRIHIFAYKIFIHQIWKASTTTNQYHLSTIR